MVLVVSSVGGFVLSSEGIGLLFFEQEIRRNIAKGKRNNRFKNLESDSGLPPKK